MDSPPLPRRGGRATLAERSAASGIGRPIDLPPLPSTAAPAASSTPPAAASSTPPAAAGGPSTTSPPPSSSSTASRPSTPVRPALAHPRHVWVTDPPGLPHGRFPGLLAQWERRPSGWAGYVVVAIPEGPDVVSVRLWVPADRLRPA